MKLSNSTPWILVLAAGLSPAVTSCKTNQPVNEQIDDSQITASVKSKLISDNDVKARNIDVNTERGIVYLLGKVDSQAERAEAERLARSCSGVKDVVNHLTVGT
jgi:hyperosmotically inducible protein